MSTKPESLVKVVPVYILRLTVLSDIPIFVDSLSEKHALTSYIISGLVGDESCAE